MFGNFFYDCKNIMSVVSHHSSVNITVFDINERISKCELFLYFIQYLCDLMPILFTH
jgi:hypothetical protein